MADIATTERLTFKFRLLALLAIVVGCFFAGDGGDPAKVVLLSAAYLAYALLLHTQVARRSHSWLVYLMIVVDAVFLGLALYWLGAAASLIIVIFPLVVPFYAVYGSYRTGVFTATAMLMAFALSQLASGRLLMSAGFLTQIPLYYLLAVLSGYLASGRIRRLEEQESLQRLVRLDNEARSLSGAVRTIQEASDLGLMLQEMAASCRALTGLPECLVGLLDRKSGSLVTRATTTDFARLGVDRLDYLVEWPRDDALVQRVLAMREPMAIRGDGADDALPPQWASHLNTRAMLAVPLVSRGVDAGVMFFYGVPDGYAFSPQEVAQAQAFADLVALVAVNAQLYEDVQVTIASVMSDLRPVVLPKATARPRRLKVIEVGDLVVDLPNRQAKIAGKPVGLTPTEFDLLAALAENSGHNLDQETLLRRVWGEDYNGRSTVVDVGMHRLRRKIEAGQGAPRRIITVRGSGYMLVPVSEISRQGAER